MNLPRKKSFWLILAAAVIAAVLVVIALLPRYEEPVSTPPAEDSNAASRPENALYEGMPEEDIPDQYHFTDLTQQEVEEELARLTDLYYHGEDWDYPLPPMNYQMEAPPPSPEELQPGATTEVEPLVYEKPLLSLTPLPDDPFYYNLLPFDTRTLVLLSEDEYYQTEQVSVEEALQAEYLYLWWDTDLTMRAQIQLGTPVAYYRILDYEPVTVVGVAQGIYTPGNFALRDGKTQFFML